MASLSINAPHRMSIRKGQAWKDAQRILKRSGPVHRRGRSESSDPEKRFNHYIMRYPYSLNIIVFKVRPASRFSYWTGVGQRHHMTGKRLSLNTPSFMLIPRSIRRKVDGFRQSKGETTSKPTQPFTGSLYKVLSRESDSAKLDVRVAESPLNLRKEGKEISVVGSSPRAVA